MDGLSKIELEKRIENCNDRLTNFLKIKAPNIIICHEIALLLRYSIVLYGEMLGSTIGSILVKPLRKYHGYCSTCLNPLETKDDEICVLCKQKEESEFGEFLIDPDSN